MKRQKRPPVGRGPMMVLTDALLLLLALVSTVFSVLTAYRLGLPDLPREGLWLLLAAAAVLAVLSTVLMSLPRYKLPLTLLALAGWGWGMWQLWEPVNWGGTALYCAVVNTIAAKIPGVAALVPIVELPDQAWPWLILLWLAVAGVIFALALAFLLCRMRWSLPVALLTLLPILPALCVTEAPAPIPMAGLIILWAVLLLTSPAGSRDPRGSARMRPMALLSSTLALALVLQNIPTSGTAQPQWAAQARADAFLWAGRLDLSGLFRSLNLSFWRGSGSTEYVNLTGGGAARTGKTDLKVYTDAPGKHYLRGWSADVYTGTRWEPLGRDAQRELDLILEGGEEPLLALGEAARRSSARPSYSSIYVPRDAFGEPSFMEVENVAAPGGCVYFPYALAELPEDLEADDAHLTRERGVWTHTLRFYPQWESAYYWEAFNGAPADDTMGEDVPRSYRDFVYDHQLQVPDETRQHLQDWLEEHAGDQLMGIFSPKEYLQIQTWMQEQISQSQYNGDAYFSFDWEELLPLRPWAEIQVSDQEAAQFQPYWTYAVIPLVTDLLAQTAAYDVDTSAPPAGEDYVNWFLNESHQGYCMHFATAGALLLRTLGVPARYVSGYVVNVPASGRAVVPDSAAHAWVEVYLDGVGWYPVDMTPGFQGEGMGENQDSDFAAGTAPAASAAPSAAPSAGPSASLPPSAAPSAAPSQAPDQADPDAPTVGIWAAPLLILALLALALLSHWGRLRLRRRRLDGPETNAAVLWAYTYHRQLIPWGGTESEELTALAGKARFSQHTLTEAERSQAKDLLSQEVRRLAQAMPRWKRLLFRILWGRP